MRATYFVKEIYYTLQGEGARAGRPAVFLRFTGCNLWSGRERHRIKAACQFCDTDFVGTDGINGGRYSPQDLVAKVESLWPVKNRTARYVVSTGGEPLLQLDSDLINLLHEAGFEVGIETNGTRSAPENVDWICVSPKPRAEIVQTKGHELKLVFPQKEPELHPGRFERWEFTHRFIQPLHDDCWEENTQRAINFCLENPIWQLSLQTHKYLDIP